MNSVSSNVTLASQDVENTGVASSDMYVREQDYRGAMMFIVMTLCVYSLGIIAFVARHIYRRSENKIQDMQISDYLSSVYTRKLDRVVRLERIKATAAKCHVLLKQGKVNQQKELSEQQGVTPEPQCVTPEPQGVTPEPQGVTPEQQGLTPVPQGVTSEPQGVSPEQQVVTPEQKVVTPEPQVVTPVPQDITPEPQGTTSESIIQKALEPQSIGTELQGTSQELDSYSDGDNFDIAVKSSKLLNKRQSLQSRS